MPRKPTKPTPKIKPAHTVAAKGGTKVRARRAAYENWQPTPEQIDLVMRLRGEELGRLHDRLMRIEGAHSDRAISEDAIHADLKAAVRARDGLIVEIEHRIASLENRVIVMEAAWFSVVAGDEAARRAQGAAKHVARDEQNAAPVPANETPASEPTESQTGTTGDSELRVDVTMTPEQA